MSEPLDPKEAATLFYAGHPLALVADPTKPFVCGQWMGERAYITRMPFDDAEAYFTENPVALYSTDASPPEIPPEPPDPPPTEAPIVRDQPYASGPSGEMSALVAETVNVTLGNWENTPDTYEFLWKRRSGGTVNAIAGQTEQTYVATEGDANKSVFCTVLATNVVGQGAVDSNDVTIMPRGEE